jgi:hypothetical protein
MALSQKSYYYDRTGRNGTGVGSGYVTHHHLRSEHGNTRAPLWSHTKL